LFPHYNGFPVIDVSATVGTPTIVSHFVWNKQQWWGCGVACAAISFDTTVGLNQTILRGCLLIYQ